MFLQNQVGLLDLLLEKFQKLGEVTDGIPGILYECRQRVNASNAIDHKLPIGFLSDLKDHVQRMVDDLTNITQFFKQDTVVL